MNQVKYYQKQIVLALLFDALDSKSKTYKTATGLLFWIKFSKQIVLGGGVAILCTWLLLLPGSRCCPCKLAPVHENDNDDNGDDDDEDDNVDDDENENDDDDDNDNLDDNNKDKNGVINSFI